MDRCRCADYEAAVTKIRFFTVGTHRPELIENYDRGEYYTTWVRNRVDLTDLRFSRPKAHKRYKLEDLPENKLPSRIQNIEKMWCPFMTPVCKYKEWGTEDKESMKEQGSERAATKPKRSI